MPCHLSIGPLARTVSDLELAMPVFATPDTADPKTAEAKPLGDSRRLKLADFRIAFFTQWAHGRGNPSDEIQNAARDCAAALDRNGATVEQSRPAFIDRTLDIGDAASLKSLPAKTLRQLMQELGGQDDQLIQIFLKWEAARQKELPPYVVDRLMDDEYPKYKSQLREFMTEFDALLLPVHSHVAMKHTMTLANMDNADGASFVFVSSLVDFLPAGTVRVGTSHDGLPIGVMVIGSPFREDIVLRVLRELETEFGGWKPPPEIVCAGAIAENGCSS